ncbi:glycosyltransferase [Bradyrhizobium lablabi]|uniref:glycosyltransferase n=1 Tax=Bradyrhizobium lablabi TaxID=722472 RepID=UPI00090A19C7|nr:glycosyltransferase [Bradyrhizobium lablabi]SHM79737.1 Glycosyl transferase family 2 [Bradyrhizobium lablabi]
MNTPLVTIVTPTFNRLNLLPETIHSILNQTWTNIEYIVVDDGSSDGTHEYLATLSDRVTVITQANAGQTAALSAGWATASGKYLGYLSDDDILLPDVVTRIVSHLENEPNAAAAFPNSTLIDEKGRIVQERVSRPFVLKSVAVDHECFIGPGALFRRVVYQQAGNWDTKCRLSPDMEFWTRVGTFGRIDFLPDALALYRIHTGSLSVRGIVSEEMVEEFIYMANKFFDGPFCPACLRESKTESLANAYLIAARGHLRARRLNSFVQSLMMARRHNPDALNVSSLSKLARASIPQPLKQSVKRLLRRTG